MFVVVLTLLVWLGTCKVTKHGLIIVDIQYDFASPSGSLSVFYDDNNAYLDISSSEYVDRINTFIEGNADKFDFIVYSIDYHPSNDCSFASTMNDCGANMSAYQLINVTSAANQGKPWEDCLCKSQDSTQRLWPDHCIPRTTGSRFMADLYDIRPLAHLQSTDDLQRVVIWRDGTLNESYVVNYKLAGSSILYDNSSFAAEIDHVLSATTNQITVNVSQVMYIFKGRDLLIDSYSVFDANDGVTRTGLFDALNAYGYSPTDTDLTIFGIAYDYCVAFTCRDAFDHGYDVTIMDQLTAPVYASVIPDLKDELVDIGMTINYGLDVSFEDSDGDSNNDDDDEDNSVWIGLTVVLVIVVVVLVIVLLVYLKRDQDRKSVEFISNPSIDIHEEDTGGTETKQMDMSPLNPED